MESVKLPLDELEVKDGEVILVYGGLSDKIETNKHGLGCGCANGAGCGCANGVGCGCDGMTAQPANGAGCGCGCKDAPNKGAGCGCGCNSNNPTPATGAGSGIQLVPGVTITVHDLPI